MRISERAGRVRGGYVHETDAGFALLEDALAPFQRVASDLHRAGDRASAERLAAGAVAGIERACASKDPEALCVWLGAQEVAEQLVEGFVHTLGRAGDDIAR